MGWMKLAYSVIVNSKYGNSLGIRMLLIYTTIVTLASFPCSQYEIHEFRTASDERAGPGNQAIVT